MAKVEELFCRQVYEVVRHIPEGRVTSYGAIAKVLGLERGSRMVGYALRGCGSVHPPVPAHRVVNSNGVLSAKAAFGGSLMQQLLENEGLIIVNDRVNDFKTVFWDPLFNAYGEPFTL
ncbi:methylated-DNA-protein-cysteine methyltransferase related protein [bacterium A37T11]|nr:methylated-DNA-protein-cysteine methyltransferase related protein [bacterium A37T11]